MERWKTKPDDDDNPDIRKFLAAVLTRVLGSLINEKIVPRDSNKPPSQFGENGVFLKYFDIASCYLSS
jgi:hypothetical protein